MNEFFHPRQHPVFGRENNLCIRYVYWPPRQFVQTLAKQADALPQFYLTRLDGGTEVIVA